MRERHRLGDLRAVLHQNQSEGWASEDEVEDDSSKVDAIEDDDDDENDNDFELAYETPCTVSTLLISQ